MAFVAIKTLTTALMTLLAISCAHGQSYSYDERSTVEQVMDGVNTQLAAINFQLRAENISSDDYGLVRSIVSIHVYREEKLQQISDPGLLRT